MYLFLQGWITDSGDVKLERVQVIMTELGHMEDEIFKRRHQNEINFKAREKVKKRQQQRVNFEMLERTQFAPMVSIFCLTQQNGISEPIG